MGEIMTQTLTNDMSIKIPLEQLWSAFKDLHHLLPRLLPGFVDSSTIATGGLIDGGVGSVRECRFSSDVPGISLTKELIEEVDDENHVFAYRVVEGEVLKKFSSYRVKWQFKPQVAGSGTDVSWTAEVVPLQPDGNDTTARHPPPDNLYRESALLLMKQMEGHLTVTGEYSQPSAKDKLRNDLLFN